MFCSKCGHVIDNEAFCPQCGKATENPSANSGNPKRASVEASDFTSRLAGFRAEQPLVALIAEGIGLFFWLYIVFVSMGPSSTNYYTQQWLREDSIQFVILGGVFVLASFAMFLHYMGKNQLKGIGRAGFILSIVVFAGFVIFQLVSLIAGLFAAVFVAPIAGEVAPYLNQLNIK